MKCNRKLAAIVSALVFCALIATACGGKSTGTAETAGSTEIADAAGAGTTEGNNAADNNDAAGSNAAENNAASINNATTDTVSGLEDILNAKEALNSKGVSSSNNLETYGYLVFASETMDFSFWYEPEHTAYVSPTGAALLAVNGDEARTGLFVSVVDAEYLPSVEDYFEEEIFNLQQRYGSAMAVQPESDTQSFYGHDLTGITYAYNSPSGETVNCAEYIEVRDGKYIFYHSRVPGGLYGPDMSLFCAAITLEFGADYYGSSDAVEGSLPIDEFDTSTVSQNSSSQAGADSAGAQNEGVSGKPQLIAGSSGSSVTDFEGGFSFEVEDSYLILSDEDATQVYPGGVMEGGNFSVERVTLDADIGTTIVYRRNEVKEMLGVRCIGDPEIQLLEIGDRRVAGFVTTYSAVDGTKTIIAEEFYEEYNGDTYCWYAIYDKGDEKTPAAFKRAMETFVVK